VLKTIDTCNGSAVNENQSANFEWKAVLEPANTNENLQNFFLLSWLKIMCGERVGIQLFKHNSNQIKTRKKPSPKPANAAEVGALECYV
jgi:hypothetical protein